MIQRRSTRRRRRRERGRGSRHPRRRSRRPRASEASPATSRTPSVHDGDIPVTAPPRRALRGDVALSTGDSRRPGDDPYAAYMARARPYASLSNPSTSPDSPITPLTTEGCPVTVQTPLGAVDLRRAVDPRANASRDRRGTRRSRDARTTREKRFRRSARRARDPCVASRLVRERRARCERPPANQPPTGRIE